MSSDQSITYPPGVVQTSVFADAEEQERMISALRAGDCIFGDYQLNPKAFVHRVALDKGLPEIPGYYGCDFRTGEFLRADAS